MEELLVMVLFFLSFSLIFPRYFSAKFLIGDFMNFPENIKEW